MVFELFGIRFKLCFSFAATVTLMLLFSRTSVALISFLSSIAHETGHVMCLFLFGVRPRSITLGFFGMRMICADENRLDYRRDAIFLLSGVAVNLFLIAVALPFCRAGSRFADYVFAVNAVIALFNLLPVETLDGGKALYLFLCSKRTPAAAAKGICVTSYLTVAFLVGFGIYLYYCRRLSLSFAAVTVYLIVQTVVSAEGLSH